jgi:hypothetical protein
MLLTCVAILPRETDLLKMGGGGRLDPRGRAATHAAFVRAEIALVLGLAEPLLSMLLWFHCGSVLREFL